MRKVALLVETSNAYGRGLLQGIIAFVRERGTWSVSLAEHGRGDRPASWLRSWQGDGLIARVETPAIASALKNLAIPMVDVSASRLIPGLPWFETDDAAIAQLAADHLRCRGFKHFAYCGDPSFNWSNWRGDHFARLLRGEGHPCVVYRPSRRFANDDSALIDDIVAWLRPLPKPLGVMGCYDLRGVQVLEACRRLGLTVPEEVAVIAVDNDELLCELSQPSLSSVIPNTRRTGYEAALLLDRMIDGVPVESGATHLIPPLGIATRQSTDVLAVEDQHVAQALHYIRRHACSGIKVVDILKAVPQSRRMLEHRFTKLIGRTPHQEIIRVRLDRVKQLLTESDLSMFEIAQRAGFTHAEYMTVMFRNHTGLPPGKYRAQHHPTPILSTGSGARSLPSLPGPGPGPPQTRPPSH